MSEETKKDETELSEEKLDDVAGGRAIKQSGVNAEPPPPPLPPGGTNPL